MTTADRTCTSCETPLPADAAFCPHCGVATPTDIGQALGQEFAKRLDEAFAGQYRIERELGRGGMAVVFLAHDVKHNRQVALKVMRPELAATLGTRRFLREIQIAAKLSHPHVLMLIDSGDVDGYLYYVMPFIHGESLRQRINRERQLPIEDALQITREVADGLQFAHDHGVVHRDIKPENILLSGSHAIIADFGIARAVTAAGGTLTTTGGSVGTPLYMSPEQASAEKQIDGRSDVYSLACVLYEMLVGEPPFTGASLQAIIAKHALETIPRVRTVRDTVPVHVDTALGKALAKIPADRFRTADEFASALSTVSPTPSPAAGALGGAGLDEQNETAPDSLSSPSTGLEWTVRQRRILIIAALAAIALLVGLGASVLSRIFGEREIPSYSDTPTWGSWRDWASEYFPVVAVADSLLIVSELDADSAFVYDGQRWRAMSIPDSFELRGYVGRLPSSRLLAVKAPENQADQQYWWLDLTADALVPAESLPRGSSDEGRPAWWYDGHSLVTWGLSLRRLTPEGWTREPTGTTEFISSLWGSDITRRFAIPAQAESLLVYDGISWELVDILPEQTAGTPSFRGGTTLADGASVALGEACDEVQGCRPLLLQQNAFNEPWREISIPAGVGIPHRQQRDTDSQCDPVSFSFTGVHGQSRKDYYVWGDWITCDVGPPTRRYGGCPPEQPCLWHVVDGRLRPVVDLAGRTVQVMVSLGDIDYAMLNDATIWRSVQGSWRVVTQVPSLPARLAAANRRVVVRSSGTEIRYQPGYSDTISVDFDSPIGSRAPIEPRLLSVRDSSIALLATDGSVFASLCAMSRSEHLGTHLACPAWQQLPAPSSLPLAIGFLGNGDLLGVGPRGLVATWRQDTLKYESIPAAAQGDSLWGLFVSEQGMATAIGMRTVIQRDTSGRWTLVRRFPLGWEGGHRAEEGGRHFAVLADGRLAVGKRALHLWDPSRDSLPLVTLRPNVRGAPHVSALQVLPDGRLVAGFDALDEPTLGGWLQFWAPPYRNNRSQRLDLPRTVDVSALADDGRYLYVVGRGGGLTIPLDSLPFADAAQRQ